jgi:hypothetical protein
MPQEVAVGVAGALVVSALVRRSRRNGNHARRTLVAR